MPAPIVSKQEVIDRLTEAFKAWGYDGATLARLSEATGLVKASLYHYFPKGKQGMGRAVLAHFMAQFVNSVLTPLQTEASYEDRLQQMCQGLNDIYAAGKGACILGVFSTGNARQLFQQDLMDAFIIWRDAFQQFLVSLGVPEAQALVAAEQTVFKVQGALVFSRGIDDNAGFSRLIASLPEDFLSLIRSKEGCKKAPVLEI